MQAETRDGGANDSLLGPTTSRLALCLVITAWALNTLSQAAVALDLGNPEGFVIGLVLATALAVMVAVFAVRR